MGGPYSPIKLGGTISLSWVIEILKRSAIVYYNISGDMISKSSGLEDEPKTILSWALAQNDRIDISAKLRRWDIFKIAISVNKLAD